jgi:hypothetical protein
MQHTTYNVQLAVFLAEPSPDRHKTGRRQALTHGERTRCKTRQCVPAAPQIGIALRDTAGIICSMCTACRYMGTNFGLPHRDYSYADSFSSDGAAKTLSVSLQETYSFPE